MLTEFGAMPDDPDHMQQLQQFTDLADKHMQSWAYWSFKDFNDITTANHGTQAMYQDGEMSQAKLQVLSRVYAQAVAGQATKLQYFPNIKTFEAVYTPNSDEGAFCDYSSEFSKLRTFT
jgi:endoglycosylceramidase